MLAGAAVCGIDLREEEYLPPDQFAPASHPKFFDPMGRWVHGRHFTTEAQSSQIDEAGTKKSSCRKNPPIPPLSKGAQGGFPNFVVNLHTTSILKDEIVLGA
jgi:hypothetical protein